MKFSHGRHCFWRWTTSVPVPVHAWAHCPKSHLYLPVRAHCPGFALGAAVDRVRAVGALPKELLTCTVFASEGTLPWLCSLAEWTESVPWAHCPKSCINFANEGALPWLALGGVDRVRAVGALPEELYQFLPMRAHCPGLLLAVDRVRASGRTARRATCICRWGRTALAASFTCEAQLEAKPSPSTTMTWSYQRNLATRPGYSNLEALQTLGNRPWRLSAMMLAKSIPAIPKDF